MKNFETLEIDTHDADELLFLFGLNKKLRPILNWNLDINNKKVSVNTVTFETSSKGIFAVSDINDYPGKANLILCGFHETTLAVQEETLKDAIREKGFLLVIQHQTKNT